MTEGSTEELAGRGTDGGRRSAVPLRPASSPRKSAILDEQRYRLIADLTYDWEYWQGADGRMLYVSPSCERVTGYAAKEFLEDPTLIDRIVHPDDQPVIVEHLHKLGPDGQRLPIDFRIICRDGTERWIGHQCRPVRDEKGRDLGIRGSNRDITEQKRIETELRASERRYRTLFETMAEGFAHHEILCDASGKPCDYRFLEVNPAFERQTGLKAVELIGRTIREVMPEIEPMWVERYGRVALTGTPEQFEARSQPLGRDFEVRAYQAGPGRFATVFTDITERKAAGEALAESERKYRELVQTANSVVLRWGSDGTICFINEPGARLLGYEADELIGRSVQALVPEVESSGRDLSSLVQDILDHPERYIYSPNENVRKDGTRIWIAWTNKAITDAKGDVCEILAIGNEITALQEANEQLQAQAEELAAINEELQTQAEELQRQTLELRRSEGALRQSEARMHIMLDERIRVQQALADREQRLRTALEGGQMGLWEWDAENDVAIWDERVFELLGVDKADPVSSKAFFQCVHRDDRDRLRADIAEALAQGGDLQREFRAVRRSGEIVWLASRSTILRNEQGQGTRMLGILFDVTPRKQMEEALRRMNDELEEEVQAQTEELKHTVVQLQEEVLRRCQAERDLHERSRLLEGFFRNTITPLAFMDRAFNFVRVNDAYAQADPGASGPEEFVGQNHFDLYPHTENRAIFEDVLRTKEPYFALARPFTYAEHPERGTSYWNWQLTPLLDEAGEVQFLVLNLQDVTERQAAMEELKTRSSQLQRLTAELSEAEDRERHRLAELLHDDLQQLLVGSKLRLSMLTRKTQDTPEIGEPIREAIDLLAESIQKSRGLSHELSPPVLHHGNLTEVLRWLVEHIYTTCGLKVHLRVVDDVEIHSQTLKTFAYKTVREMLFNVVKHANVKRAAVVVRRVDRAIRVTVADRGRGFDPQRLDTASQNGFGLFHIRERLQLLGGTLTVQSAPGRGSRFVLTIPLDVAGNGGDHKNNVRTSPAPRGATKLRPGDRATQQKFRILIVDDHKVMRDGLAALLEEEPDIEVVGQAGNGREAITLTAQLQPDVVVMDVVMPIINGEEATRQIKQRWPEVRIMALSMLEEDATRERMREAGAEAFVSKAGPSEVIAAAIRRSS